MNIFMSLFSEIAARLLLLIALVMVISTSMSGCSTTDDYARPPLNVPPNTPPNYIEKVNNGSIFQPSMVSTSLFSGDRRPRNIGETLKINIAEKTTASRKLNTDTSRENAVAVQGPGDGTSTSSSLIDKLINLSATASGSDSFKGKGTTDNTSSLTGENTASVINVLPNGHLVVAGERGIALNGGISTLRVSGIVNPKDIKAGNAVASSDVLNAHIEVGGQGDVQEAASRNWLQRALTKHLTIW